MYKEIGRKLTSLTLLTILLASVITYAHPGVLPVAEASHNANLFVSSENSQFNNYFAGPQVIEVVVNDNDIKTLDDVHGEPDVTVNGKRLRMAQASDGNWYGYFASRAQAQAADQTVGQGGKGLDFGEFCSQSSTGLVTTGGFADTVGVTVARSDADGSNGTATIATCTTGGSAAGTLLNHVVRENKSLNTNAAVPVGQIGITIAAWPAIQLYDFSAGGNVIVKYNKGGGSQTTTLTFDTIPSNLINVATDRSTYPQGAQVHLTMTDPQLNIDPTDEDSWTWGASVGNSTIFYQAFDENGISDAAFTVGGVAFNTAAMQNLAGNLTTLMFEKNGKLEINLAAQTDIVAAFGDNDDQNYTAALTNTLTTNVITFTESDPKSGIFGNYDESDNANLDILANAARGKSATVRYNDVSHSVVVGFGFATLDISAPDGIWNSGEEIPVTLVDSDANKNSRADEDLDLFANSTALIPTMKIGKPFTLNTGDSDLFYQQITINTLVPGNTIGGSNGTIVAVSAQPALVLDTPPVQTFSQRELTKPQGLTTNSTFTFNSTGALAIDLERTFAQFKDSVKDPQVGTTTPASRFKGVNFFNYDVRSLNTNATAPITSMEILLVVNRTAANAALTGGVNDGLANSTTISLANVTSLQGLINLNATAQTVAGMFSASNAANNNVLLLFVNRGATTTLDNQFKPIVADFFTFGLIGDGVKQAERVNNAIYRFELEETGDNTSTFIGSAEFKMLNQLSILQASTYSVLATIDDQVKLIVMDDSDDEDSPRINYNDLGGDGSITPVADQQAAPANSGVVSFDKDTYKLGDTVTITLEDNDLNVDNDVIDIYSVVAPGADAAADTVGLIGLPVLISGAPLGKLLDVTFDDLNWVSGSITAGTQAGTTICLISSGNPGADGLSLSGFTLIETGTNTGVLKGDFLLPNDYCDTNTGERKSTTGKDIAVDYEDFRDASGQSIEVGDSAGVRANTGSVSLDRTIYPVPFGSLDNIGAGPGPGTTAANVPSPFSLFPIHLTGLANDAVASKKKIDRAAETLGDGALTVIARVTDPDFDQSFTGQDVIAANSSSGVGPVKVTVSRGSSSVTIGYGGGPAVLNGPIDVADANPTGTRQFGPMTEIAPDAGIFELEFLLAYTDGPADTRCPKTDQFTNLVDGTNALTTVKTKHFNVVDTLKYCILQGDIITVQYTDPADASGDENTVTDSASFDLRNGVLQSDKSVYIIGADMILTLIEPDLDLDSQTAESYDLDLIEWDSNAATLTMGDIGGEPAKFDPEPSDFRETGENTGIFQIVIEIPDTLGGQLLNRGEEIQLEYTDWGPSGADFVGGEDQDVDLVIYTSNFGATVELDQKVYTWTDKVFITVVAPDHNFDSNLIDTIGDSNLDKVVVATRGNKLSQYHLTETGTDTGIFTGEVILTGFCHDADGDTQTGSTGAAGSICSKGDDTNPRTNPTTGGGPTNGFLQADDDDGLTVSFEFTEDETVVGSALIRWNIGETQWLEASYPATGQGVVRVVDPDLNLNPEAVDNFDINVWSDSDAGGIDLTVTETNEATGIFEGTVYFTITDESSGHRLRVAEGDTVTGEYQDNTLPSPYTTADELEVTATTFIGTVVPPLERAPASNPRVVDAFGNQLDTVNVDQQVQITADLANGQDRDQPFAYLVQISKGGVTYSLSWITGSLAPGQSLNPAQSWTPSEAGTYDVQIFVWQSVDNPDALSIPLETTVTVS